MSNPIYWDGMVWVMFENHGYSEVSALSSHVRLIQKGAVCTQWQDVGHPSGPNYRAFASGDFWNREEVINTAHPTIAAAFPRVNVINWRGVPAARHQPFGDMLATFAVVDQASFDALLKNPIAQWDVEDQSSLWYVGVDDLNDGHSAPISVADTNLNALLDELDASPWFNAPNPASGKYPALFVAWDESFVGDDIVFAAWYGHGVKAGYTDTAHRNHYSFCKTVTENVGLPPLANAAGMTSLIDVFV